MAHGVSARDRKKEVFWGKHIQRQPRSGESIRGYCRRHALKEPSFYWWRSNLARRETPAPKPAFVPVHIVTDTPALIEIVLPGGKQVRISGPVDKQALADVLTALATSGA
jgi:hypothetical protein